MVVGVLPSCFLLLESQLHLTLEATTTLRMDTCHLFLHVFTKNEIMAQCCACDGQGDKDVARGRKVLDLSMNLNIFKCNHFCTEAPKQVETLTRTVNLVTGTLKAHMC